MKQLISLLIPFLLTSCAWLDDSNESKLKGERMPILASAPTEAVMDSAKTSMRLPVAVPAKSWNYSHLVANDLPENIAIEPNKIKIGAKVAKITKRDKIFAGPVLANGNV